MNKNKRLVFISIYCALALVLDYIKTFIPFLNMPTGGSINIALIPIVVCSFHLGYFDGMVSGFLWWMISSIIGLNPYYLSFLQYICDYVLPSIVVGLSSLFYKKKNIFEIEIGIIFMMIIRTLFLILSGAIFWPGDAASNSIAAWSTSVVYNLPYSIGTLIMLLIVVPFILKSIKKIVL